MQSCSFSGPAILLPDPDKDESQNEISIGLNRKVVLAGGCFWGIQAVFQHVCGVKTAISGYTGGDAAMASYDAVSRGLTSHAEAVEITYSPQEISLGKILKIFFSVAHNPTELNRQGPDHGTQYRSAIFAAYPEHAEIAQNYIHQLNDAKRFNGPIVTQVHTLDAFYSAENYHQDYARLNPDNPYVATHDMPKLVNLQKYYPELFRKL